MGAGWKIEEACSEGYNFAKSQWDYPFPTTSFLWKQGGRRRSSTQQNEIGVKICSTRSKIQPLQNNAVGFSVVDTRTIFLRKDAKKEKLCPSEVLSERSNHIRKLLSLNTNEGNVGLMQN